MATQCLTDKPPARGSTGRGAILSERAAGFVLHSLVVILITAGALVLWHGIYFNGMKSSDGYNYLIVARNFSEGKGLQSSIILPGLINVVPTDRTGQAAILQQPLWPLVLGEWFKLFGASVAAMHVLSGLLCIIVVLECWWIAYLMSRSIAAAYVAVLLLLGNQWVIGSLFYGMNVSLQSSLIGGIFLLLFWRPNWALAIGMGVLVGLGTLTRENSVFCMAAIGYCWLAFYKDDSKANSIGAFLLCGKHLLRLAFAVATVLGIAYGLFFLESARKASLIGRWDSPVFRLTFLYGTPAITVPWHYVFDSEVFKINPMEYFAHHPRELLRKMVFMLQNGFLKGTLPVVISSGGFFIPVVFPWLFRAGVGRRVAIGFLLTLGCQLALGSMSYLHFSYFFAYLPVLCPVVTTTALELVRRTSVWQRRTVTARVCAAACGVLAVYALMPLFYNCRQCLAGKANLAGDLTAISSNQEAKMVEFIEKNTPTNAVVACASYHASTLAWFARRTIVLYISTPALRIADCPMWRTIDERVPLDFILLSSTCKENSLMPVLPGFQMVRSMAEPDVQAWLFRRSPAHDAVVCR